MRKLINTLLTVIATLSFFALFFVSEDMTRQVIWSLTSITTLTVSVKLLQKRGVLK